MHFLLALFKDSISSNKKKNDKKVKFKVRALHEVDLTTRRVEKGLGRNKKKIKKREKSRLK